MYTKKLMFLCRSANGEFSLVMYFYRAIEVKVKLLN